MAVTLLFPTATEAAPLQALRPDLDIRICGVGPVEVARFVARMLREQRCDGIVLCGVAGSYGEEPRVGDVIAVRREQTASLPAIFRGSYEASLPIELPQVVSNTVMCVGCEPCGAQIENMEGAALFSLCAEASVPCGEIRAISNRVDDLRSEWQIEVAVKNLAMTINNLFPR
ncbi:MAG: hypothetical protein IJ348_01700 [Alistipes sp.]|nr:hypothetical protein [Alistipes sp.]